MTSRRPKIPVIEFLKDRIYLGAYDFTPVDNYEVVHFTIDDSLPYNSFHHDFGPLHVGHLYRFAVTLHEVLAQEENEGKAVVLYSHTNPRARANAACVLCSYMVLIQSWPPHLALAPIAQADPPLMPFRDAGYAQSDFGLTIQDIVYGIWRAKERNLLDLKSFNLEEYELYERVDQGDFNEIPPHYVAFASPQQSKSEKQLSYPFLQVLDFFEKKDIKLVVRLNSHLYDKTEFEKRGIKHVDLIFEDGTCPTMDFVKSFIGMAESVIAENGKIAVHCKAGLGRTGCLIGAHLIYTYGFTASEVIGYMRFLRPGMVVGPQQHWLYLHQNEFRDWRRTMEVSNVAVDRLAGYSPLVPLGTSSSLSLPNPCQPINISRVRSRNTSTSVNRKISGTGKENIKESDQEHSATPPHTPERSILGQVDNTHSALPVPTPGQPRKNLSPSVKSSRNTSTNILRGIDSSRKPNHNNTSTSAGLVSSDDENMGDVNKLGTPTRNSPLKTKLVETNSDDEDEFIDDNNENIPIMFQSAKRNITDSLSPQQQMAMRRQLRNVSNPSPQRKASRSPSFQLTKTITTTTTTTTLSSSPPSAAAASVISPGLDSGALRRSNRISSYSSNSGIRKVSAKGRR